MSENRLVDRETAREMLKIGKTKLKELIRDGKIDTIKIGRKRLIKVASLNKIMDEGVQ